MKLAILKLEHEIELLRTLNYEIRSCLDIKVKERIADYENSIQCLKKQP